MEATKNIKMNMDGTIRAKVLQYKSDGNTLTEKRETLKKYAEGVYYTTEKDGYGNTIHGIVFEANGVFWWSRQALLPDELNTNNIFCQKVMEKRRNFERDIIAQSEAGQYVNNLQIEVMRRLGHEVAALQAAHDEYIRQREERDRQQAEEAERRERERREAEKRHNAEVLADGKEKLLKHESITVEQIELIAEAVGYKIHIRTIGFMREKVTEAVLREDDTVTVWGRKLTSRNIDGTAKVMHELHDRLKAQAEEDANEPVKHISEIMETCRLYDEVTGEETDEYKYYKWLTGAHCGTYRTIADKALAEALAWIFEAAYRKGKGHIIAMNNDGVLIEIVIAATPTETPLQSTEAAETANVSAEGENVAETPQKHISEIMETCRTWDDEKRDYTDEYKYYTWLANHIPEHKATNKNTTELILEEVRERISAAATLAAHGVPKCDIEGAVCAVVNRLAKMEDILQFYNRTEPPQPSETPQTAEWYRRSPQTRPDGLKTA